MNATSVVVVVGVFVSWAPLRVPFYRVKEADRGYNGEREQLDRAVVRPSRT